MATHYPGALDDARKTRSLGRDASSARSKQAQPADAPTRICPAVGTVTHTLAAIDSGLCRPARSSRPISPPIGGPRICIDCQPGCVHDSPALSSMPMPRSVIR